jgi:ADP-heptose:LPS heptosyltransferase
MTNKGLSKAAFYVLDRLTDWSPSHVPAIFQSAFQAVMGNRPLFLLYQWYYRQKVQRVKRFDKILVVSDVNLGDAIMLFASVEAIRYAFPDSSIDYICNRVSGELLPGFNAANHVFTIFSGNAIPLQEERDALLRISEREDYSLIVNFSPFIAKNNFKKGSTVIQMYIPLASYLVHLTTKQDSPRHLSLVVHSLMNAMLAFVARRGFISTSNEKRVLSSPPYRGNSVFLTSNDIDQAHLFLTQHHLTYVDHIVFFNPDGAMRYTQIPLRLQIKILRKLAASKSVDAILLGTGRALEGIEQTLLNSLPESLQSKVVIVPPVSPGAYAALMDTCDVFLSSDTGPVHIAAARKVSASSYPRLRNRTAVVTVFGSGDSTIYGYDSQKQGHIAANQEAPSRAFIANAPCRNITCANKWGKTCKEIRCFAGLRADDIADYILTYVRTLCESEEHVFEPNIH